MSYAEINSIVHLYRDKAQKVFDELSEGDKRLLKGQEKLNKDLYEEIYKGDYIIRQMAREIATLREVVRNLQYMRK